jgi:hypothetical protein
MSDGMRLVYLVEREVLLVLTKAVIEVQSNEMNDNLPEMASIAPFVSSGSKSRTVLPMIRPSSTS